MNKVILEYSEQQGCFHINESDIVIVGKNGYFPIAILDRESADEFAEYVIDKHTEEFRHLYEMQDNGMAVCRVPNYELAEIRMEYLIFTTFKTNLL